MSELISVIVPIYNVEKYLKRCIDSIINQTYKNLEIILVDDGSPDDCAYICDQYLKVDDRIKVIHKENGGLSDARNIGIQHSNGEYISFIDSDDFISPNFIETLFTICKETESDIAQCKFIETSDSEFKDEFPLDSFKSYSNIEMIKTIYSNMYIESTVVWNKLYKKTLFNEILFPKGKNHEDEATTYKLFYYANKITTTDKVLYYYFMSPNSITRSAFNIKRLDFIDAIKGRMHFFEVNENKELYEITQKKYCFYLIEFYLKCKEHLNNEKEILANLKNEYKLNYSQALISKNVSMKAKVMLIILRIQPSLYKLLYKLNQIFSSIFLITTK